MPGSNLSQAASIAPKVLVSQQMADATEDTVYTAPSTGSAVLKHGTVCNVTGGTVLFSLSILKSGQTPGSGQHRVINQYSLNGGDTLSLADYIAGACLGPSDFIAVQAGTATALDVIITGVENT